LNRDRPGSVPGQTPVVYLVGAGPGAADLLTLRAARVLGEAGIVFHDALVPEEILGLAVHALKVPVGKRSGRHSTAQRFINKRLADAARRHKVVVRLKGGDPMLFGRAHEEISFLEKNGVKVEIVPGVTAALAASADLGISLTRRGAARSVSFVTPRVGEGEAPSSWIGAVLGADTAAIYMGAGEARSVAAALMGAGKPGGTPVAIVENASLPQARVRRGRLDELERLACGLSGGPAVILLGAVYGGAAFANTTEGSQVESSGTNISSSSTRMKAG
jgi:uroporphyrin-III C-methyltransferase